MESKEWYYSLGDQTFMVSTKPEHISHDFIQASFSDPVMYWAKPISSENLRTMLENSCFLGLYLTSPDPLPRSKSTAKDLDPAAPLQPPCVFIQIGMARLVTDYMTLAFLTDVFVVPEHQGKGLGQWMIQCVKELTDAMPGLRSVMFMAKNAPHAVKFYEELLHAQIHDQEKGKVVFMSSRDAQVDS
ncbi:hypothetical protein V1505DRAFT_379078 [Lipomyces doorenjongii]